MRDRAITILVKKHEEKIYHGVAALAAKTGEEWFHLDDVAKFLRDEHAEYVAMCGAGREAFALLPLDLFPCGWTDDILAQGLKSLTSRAMLAHRRTERGNEVKYLAPSEHQLCSVRSPAYTHQIVEEFSPQQTLGGAS